MGIIQRTDYLLHFLFGIWICYTFFSFGMFVSLGAVVLFALLKDGVWDKLMKKGTFEWKDILSTVASFPVVVLEEQIKGIFL